MKITILGADLPVSDKVIYAIEEASRKYINAMKNSHSHSHCPSKNSPCGNEGEHRCCLCLKDVTMTQDWKDEIRSVSIKSDTTSTGLEVVFEPEVLIKLIESLLSKEFIKGRIQGMNEQQVDNEECIRQEERNAVLSEERQFILNILDGIDIADAQMGIVGGTQAIRQALESRTINHEQLTTIFRGRV